MQWQSNLAHSLVSLRTLSLVSAIPYTHQCAARIPPIHRSALPASSPPAAPPTHLSTPPVYRPAWLSTHPLGAPGDVHVSALLLQNRNHLPSPTVVLTVPKESSGSHSVDVRRVRHNRHLSSCFGVPTALNGTRIFARWLLRPRAVPSAPRRSSHHFCTLERVHRTVGKALLRYLDG